MSDPFQILGVSRRCHFSEEELKSAYHEKAKSLHPDSIHGDTAEFVHLNSAYRKLLDPAERLKALLSAEGDSFSANALPTRGDLFEQTSRIVEKCSQWLEKLHAAASAVVKSSVLLERTALETELGVIYEAVAAWNRDLVQYLEKIDASPQLKTQEKLSSLAVDFSYSGRWLKKLRDQKFQLSAE